MLRLLAGSALVVLALQAAPSSLAAQSRSTVSGADLQAAVTSAREAHRATVLQFLQQDRVVETATSMGVSSADLSARVATLDDATLSNLAERTQAAELGLAGGEQYILISTTAIIIILLILILVT
jgi:hypothetical protein